MKKIIICAKGGVRSSPGGEVIVVGKGGGTVGTLQKWGETVTFGKEVG